MWTVPFGKDQHWVYTILYLYIYCCNLNWTTETCTQLSNTTVMLQLWEPFCPSSWVSSETCCRPLRLETVWEMHKVVFGASHFPLPAAHQGTVTLTVCNVGLATDKVSPFKPSFFLFIALVLVYLRSIFLSPDILSVFIRNEGCCLKAKPNLLSSSLWSQCSWTLARLL